MLPKDITPGDFLAYLDGVDLPHVAQAVQASPELRRQLAEVRQTDQALQRLFGGLPMPDPQDLVDVATGQATPQQELRVAAAARSNPAVQQELDLLRSAAAPPQRSRLPRFIAAPQTAIAGVRAHALSDTEQSFYAAELAAQVVLRRIPPTAETWRIEGYVTRADQPASEVRITLQAPGRRPRPRVTDANGFFTFPRLAPGTYHLQAHFAQGIVIISDIELPDV